MIDRTMTEAAMQRHVLIAYIRDELDAMILNQGNALRAYVDAQLDDEMGSRQTALEQSAAFLAWLTIAQTTRAHMDDGLCWDEAGTEFAPPCDIHELNAELETQGVRDWRFDPRDFFAGKEFYLNPIEPGLPFGTTGGGTVVHTVDEVAHFAKVAKSGYGKSVVIRDQSAADLFFPADDNES